MADAKRDTNSVTTLLGVSNVDGITPVVLWADPVTHRLLVDLPSSAGTVTSVSVVTANGVSGSVATATTTPAITLTLGAITPTSVNGLTIGTTTGTFNVTNGQTITATATTTLPIATQVLTFAGPTAPRTITFPDAAITVARTDAGNTFTGHQTIEGVTTTGATGTGKLVFDGTPTLVTPNIGVATATSINGLTITASTGTLTITNLKTLSVSDTTTLANAAITLGNGKVLTLSDSTTLATNSITFAGGEVITFSATNALSLLTTGTTASTFPAGTHTLSGLDVAEAMTGAKTMSSIILPDQGTVRLTTPTTDLKVTGFTTSDYNSGYSSTAIGDLVYLDVNATWQKANAATSAATKGGLLGIAMTIAASGAAVTVALPGSFIYSTTGFPTWTIGSPIYMDSTSGAMTQTQPTTTDYAIRVVGWAIHADKMYFFPSPDYITHT